MDYRIKLVRAGKRQIEEWWIRTGRKIREPSDRSEEIERHVSFVNYDLKMGGFGPVQPTELDDEFIVSGVGDRSYASFAAIVRYHGFEVIT